MRKDVDIVIIQKPISVKFECPYCCNKIEVDFKVFKNITGNDLCGLLYDSTYFKCPNCDGDLETDGVELD